MNNASPPVVYRGNTIGSVLEVAAVREKDGEATIRFVFNGPVMNVVADVTSTSMPELARAILADAVGVDVGRDRRARDMYISDVLRHLDLTWFEIPRADVTAWYRERFTNPAKEAS